MIKEWSNKKLGIFNNHCHLYNFNHTLRSKNINCSNWEITNNGSYIQSGNSDFEDCVYVNELSFGVMLKKNGFIEFRYKLNTLEPEICRFYFITNYNFVLRDICNNTEWKTYKLDLKKGYHNFIWHFQKGNKTEDINKPKAYISYIKIDGLELSQTFCKKCKWNSKSKEGSENCIYCTENQYYNEDLNTCENCPNNTFSYPNSIGNISCLEKPPCRRSDFKEIFNDCFNGLRLISFIPKNHSHCNYEKADIPSQYEEKCEKNCQKGSYNDINKNECINCPNGFFSNNETFKSGRKDCIECPQHLYTTRYFSTVLKDSIKNFKRTCFSNISNHCTKFSKFKLSNDKLISGYNLPNMIEMNLFIKFEIFFEGKISFVAKLLLQTNEYFKFKINGVIEEQFEKGEYKKEYMLNKGKYEAIWSYIRFNSSNTENAIEINLITIEGSDLGGGINCVDCPKGTVRNNSSIVPCVPCERGFISNTKRNECIPCKNDSQFKNKVDPCLICPVFTTPSSKYLGCNLLDVIHNKLFLLKFFPFKKIEQLSALCNEELERCIGNFIGPITRKDNSSQMYYISPFNLNELMIRDFQYEGNKDDNVGHIFGVFNFHDNNNNLKHRILKNIGKEIEYVKVFPFIIIQNKIINRHGFFIKYKSHENCLSNYSLFYSSYIVYICDQLTHYTKPKLIHINDDNCTYVFEWRGKNFCPACTKMDQSQSVKGLCINSKRAVFYRAEDCLILNVTGKQIAGVNYTNNDFSNVIMHYRSDKGLEKYFESEGFTSFQKRNLAMNQVDLSLNDSYYYVSNIKEEEECSIFENLDGIVIIMIFCIPIFYFFFIILCICVYCKYRKVKNDYLRLKDKESKETDSLFNNNRLEGI